MRWSLLCLLFGCGTDAVPPGSGPGSDPLVDAPPPPGTPLVSVTAPAKGTAFYVTEGVTITWTVDDDDPSLSCDVSASDNGGAAIPIASAVVVAAGSTGSATWATTGVAPDINYVAIVSCSDGAQTGSGRSGEFVISPPPENVPFSTITGIFTSTCTSAPCHDSTAPQDGLNLTAAAAYNDLVNQPSSYCTSTLLVKPGSPSESYLVQKLQGSGPCFVGTKMPKPPYAITSTQLQQIRDWIFNGAPST